MAIEWDRHVLPIHSTMFARKFITKSGGLSLTGVEQVVQSSSDFWEATLTLKIRKRSQVLAYRALQAQNWGRSGEYIVPACPTAGLPRGDFSGDFDSGFSGDIDPVVLDVTAYSSAVKGALSITLSMGFVPLPGMWFSIGNRLYAIATVTQIISLSRYTVTFVPKLRAAVSAGAAVDFYNLKCLMRLAQDDTGQMNLDMLRFADVTLNFVEVPT